MKSLVPATAAGKYSPERESEKLNFFPNLGKVFFQCEVTMEADRFMRNPILLLPEPETDLDLLEVGYVKFITSRRKSPKESCAQKWKSMPDLIFLESSEIGEEKDKGKGSEMKPIFSPTFGQNFGRANFVDEATFSSHLPHQDSSQLPRQNQEVDFSQVRSVSKC